MHNNALSGILPPEWGALSNMTYLYLHENRLSGSMPGEWGDMAALSQL